MDSSQGKKWVEDIILHKEDEIRYDGKKSCIIINGEWGVGKTYCVKGLLSNSEINREFATVYCSLFGSDMTIENFERKLKAQILSSSVLKEKTRKKVSWFGAIGDVIADRLGIDLKTCLDYIPIEDIGNGEETVIILDDIERKSASLSFEEILGIAERMTTKFTVIMILNKEKMSDEDRHAYHEFREKVVDYELEIDSVNREYLFQMLGKDFDEYTKYEFLQKFLCGHNTIRNMRLAEKFCKLVLSVQQNLRVIYSDDKYIIQKRFIPEVYKVILYYFCEKEEESSNKVLYDFVENVFKEDEDGIKRAGEALLENYPLEGVAEKDCLKILKGYLLDKQEFDEILNRMRCKIREKDKMYFSKQVELLMVSEVFCRIGFECEEREMLFDIAKELYSFNDIYIEESMNYGALNPYFFDDNKCDISTDEMCSDINRYNYEKTIEEVKKKMDNFLAEGKAADYYDYVDCYGGVLGEEEEYLCNHVKRLYEKLLESPDIDYVAAISLLSPMIDEFIDEYLDDREKMADLREKTLINKMKDQKESGNAGMEKIKLDMQNIIASIGD